MRSFRIAGILCALALSVSACAAAIPLIGTAVDVLGKHSTAVSTTADTVIINGSRGLILANNAYQAAANGVAPFVAAKRFSPATVDRIEKLNDRALQLLDQGDAGMTLAQRAAGVFAIADELSALAGK
jgi:hypothetical protein